MNHLTAKQTLIHETANRLTVMGFIVMQLESRPLTAEDKFLVKSLKDEIKKLSLALNEAKKGEGFLCETSFLQAC